MTPLPWWVLLATLLGRANGVPIHEEENACVRFCRTLGTPEACDLQILALLQSYERHVGRRDELARCFFSCDEDEDPGQEGKKEICEKTRKDFIQSGRCGCVDPIKQIQSNQFEQSEKYPSNLSWDVFEDILARYYRYVQEISVPGTLDLVEESENSLERFDKIELDLKLDESGDFEVEEVKVDMEKLNEVESFVEEVQEETNGKVETHAVTTTELASSEEQVDWEMWCMTQCDHGQGGTACNCDIIP